MTLERAELMLRRAQLRMTSSRRLAIEEEAEEAGRTVQPPSTPLAGGVTRGVRRLGELAPLVRSEEARVVRRLTSLGRKRPGRMSMNRCYADIGGQSLRIFLSSTFRDMSGERELLMKKYVPALRQVCHDKGVHLTVVDLRWGVTVEQASLGEGINICLAEVEACQYFVGFLGSRYGWCPQRSDIARSTFTKFPFLNSYVPGRSATEMEVLYGALGWGPKSYAAPRKAFFYHRSEAFLETVPQREMETYKERDTFMNLKLRDLKARYAHCGYANCSYTHHGYTRHGYTRDSYAYHGMAMLTMAVWPQGAHRHARRGVYRARRPHTQRLTASFGRG